MRTNETALDVVANNIANVNTTGFKAERAVSTNTIVQNLRAGAEPDGDRGGADPLQVGVGAQTESNSRVLSQGALQDTGRKTDLAVEGDGFFTVRRDDETMYTRHGAFDVDADGRLVGAGGALLQGWQADENGEVNLAGPISDLSVELGQAAEPVPTSEVQFAGVLPAGVDADAPVEDRTLQSAFSVIDSQGTQRTLETELVKQSPNEWSLEVRFEDDAGNEVTLTPTPPPTLEFDAEGALVPDGNILLEAVEFGPGQDPQDIELVLGGESGSVAQFEADATFRARDGDGRAAGELSDFEIANDGTVVGQFSNGTRQTLGVVALSTFPNPGGLALSAQGLLSQSANSGEPQTWQAGAGGTGRLVSGVLEGSNVELGDEFARMIVSQRAFAANARVVTTSDETLSELVNLRR